MGHICEQVFRCYYWNNNPQSCLILLKCNCIIIIVYIWYLYDVRCLCVYVNGIYVYV